ncbi:CopC domain containing protein [Candidatus Nanopelagicaceae bacterium]
MKSVKDSILATIAASISLALFSSPTVFAHSALVSSNPAANSSIEEMPPVVEMTFNQRPLELKSGDANFIRVIDPDGNQISFETSIEGTTLTSPVSPSRQAGDGFINGKYRVEYRFVSPDGHVIESDFSFNLSTTAVTQPAKDVDDDQEEEPSSSTGLIAIGGAAFLLLLIALWLVSRRRRA